MCNDLNSKSICNTDQVNASLEGEVVLQRPSFVVKELCTIVSVSLESTLDCNCNDLISKSNCNADRVNASLEGCGGPARTEF